MTLSLRVVKKFQKEVYDYYRARGRHGLPWRRTEDPYKILVSEVMLQQTQVLRVVPKYKNFLRAFPTVVALAAAPRADVVRAWSGLGYNRRALYLHTLAKVVKEEYGGHVPPSYQALIHLPGIGHATASAVRAFAFNRPTVFVETNIRSAFIHYFFNRGNPVPRRSDIRKNVRMSWGVKAVDDKTILEIVEKTLDKENPREWYWALMDYGVMVKETYGNPNGASAQYVKQSPFQGSDRQVRGALLRTLSENGKIPMRRLRTIIRTEPGKIKVVLHALVDEGFVEKKRGEVALAH